jgi:hypothetical protein
VAARGIWQEKLLRPGTEPGPTDEPAYEAKLAALGEPATLSLVAAPFRQRSSVT